MNVLSPLLQKIKWFFHPSKRVSDYYDAWTHNYVSGFGDIFQSKQADDEDILINYFIEQMGIQDGMHLLDAGCGICGPAIRFAQKKQVVIDAITLSVIQVDLSLEKIKSNGLSSSVHPILGDFHNLKTVSDGQYDLVYFLESLVHSSKPKAALAEAKRILKPDGILYIKDLFEKTPYSPDEYAAIRKWVNHNNKNLALHIQKKEHILGLLRDLGFQLEFCQLMKIDTNQNRGNQFVVDFGIMPDPIENSLPPYLEWYEIKAVNPGPKIVFKM